MSTINLQAFLSYLRSDIGAGDDLADVAQQALDSAEQAAAQFIGDDLDELADSFGALPPAIASAVMALAQCEFDALEPQRERAVRERAESLLRPFRRETGIAGGSSTES